MNFYEQQMRQMFGSTDIIHDAKFVGKTMLGKLDEELRVKLQFISTRTSGQYDTVQATIINRTEGVVDKENFKFADIIGPYKRKGLSDLDPHMWDYGGKSEWYTPITIAQKAQIADTVLDYISMYQDEDMSMTVPGM